jgi:hypothetical protein
MTRDCFFLRFFEVRILHISFNGLSSDSLCCNIPQPGISLRPLGYSVYSLLYLLCHLLTTLPFSCQEIEFNTVRDLSRMMKVANVAHVKGLMRVMKYYVAMPKRGLVLRPHGVWDGGADYEFELEGWSHSDWANNTENRRSISG